MRREQKSEIVKLEFYKQIWLPMTRKQNSRQRNLFSCWIQNSRDRIKMTKIGASALLKHLKSLGVSRRDPPTLENVIKESAQSKANWGLPGNDIVFALAFWSMIKSGFECPSAEKILPKNWKHKTRQVYEAHFILPPFSNLPVKLVALPAGEILCINVLASDVSSKNVSLKSLAVHSPVYVLKPHKDPVLCRFSDLSELQSLFRDVLIWPIRCSILTEQGILNGSLTGVSDELKLKIVRHLPVKDVLMLSETCHDLNRICNDQGLWKTLFHDNFKSCSGCLAESEKGCNSTDWKENFKEVYVRQKSGQGSQDSLADSYHSVPEMPQGSEIDFDVD